MNLVNIVRTLCDPLWLFYFFIKLRNISKYQIPILQIQLQMSINCFITFAVFSVNRVLH